jgi:hypothetical protein
VVTPDIRQAAGYDIWLEAVLPQSAYSVEKLEDQMRPNFSQNAFIPKV